ncbi:MAG: hypothetical protein DRJ66_04695 [Thermoprotei archaeon]|nr:MAG: hypothetical protein DRJ66_04695 [Thermoprotei archaeon]RLF20087.1 MAG: hypothetical protein DRZ82_03535 [Thermoprotei archaeon]
MLLVLLLYILLNSTGLISGNYCSLKVNGLFFICPIGFLQRAAINCSFTTSLIVGILISVVLIMLFGRLFCGWICPIGILMRLLGRTKKVKENIILLMSFTSLSVLLIISWLLRYPVFCLVCPVGIISRLIIWSVSGTINISSVVIGIFMFIIVMVFNVTIIGWCAGVCPLGALQIILSYFKVLRIRVKENCIKCKLCSRVCPLGLRIYEGKNVANMACMTCLKCVFSCPVKALKLRLSFSH